MTYQTDCLARADCIGFWGLADAGGATQAADAGPNNVPLPKLGTPTFGSTGFVSGLATSLSCVGGQGVGVGGTSNAIFERTTALTMCGWVWVVTALSPQAGWQLLFGRDSLWGVYMANSTQVSAQHDTTGMTGNTFTGIRSAATYGAVYSAGDVMFMAISWSKETGYLQMVLNGALHAEVIRDINFSTGVGDSFRIGSGDAGHTEAVRYSGHALFNTQLGTGELRALMLANSSFTPPSNGSIEPASPSTTTSSGLLGAKITANGARITTTGGKAYRPDEYGAMGLAQGGIVLPASSGWDAKLPFRAARTGYEWLATQVQRDSLRGVDGLTYWAGEGVTNPWHFAVPPPPTDPTAWWNASMFFRTSGVAILNHWVQRGVGGADSPLVKLCSSLLDTIDANTDAQGLCFPPQSAGLPFQMWSDTVLAVLAIKPYVTAAKWNQWVNLLIKAGNWCWTTGAASTFYINGNQNLSACVIFYGLFLLTGQQIWLDRYNATWAFTLYPTDAGTSGQGFGGARSAGFGLYSYTGGGYNWTAGAAPLQARVADDAALLAMSATLGKAFITESDNSGPPGTMGMDHDYLQLQINQAWKLARMTGLGARELRLFNVMFNQHWTRVTPGSTTTSWTADFTGGTRRNSVADPYFDGIIEYVKASGLRTDFTTDIYSHWEAGVWPAFRDWWHGNGLGDRYLGTTVGNILIGSPQWPGWPT